MEDIPRTLERIRSSAGLSQEQLAQLLGVSKAAVDRWERGTSRPSPTQARKIVDLSHGPFTVPAPDLLSTTENGDARDEGVFSSRGLQRSPWNRERVRLSLSETPLPPLFHRLAQSRWFSPDGPGRLETILRRHQAAAATVSQPIAADLSAGKNTYTYDAHTYHTKVPPQGIATLLQQYLPQGGLILDPFAGSGMTGVACRVLGYDVILNELSPAAAFIADRFLAAVEPAGFEAGVQTILEATHELRTRLYTTVCRECGKPTEIIYTVWSYNVCCSYCEHEFLLWDHCRSYGRRVRDHKILRRFPCPACRRVLDKSALRRTVAVPVQIGYKCCGSRQQEVTHPPSAADLELIQHIEQAPPVAEGFYPRTALPDGVNLRQPKHHGLDRIDRFYTARNLSAMSHLWRAIHCVEDLDLAAQLAFVVTSLYQRVTRLSEFRFWGGSGNTARFNVPFIFNEANVFLTYLRKARTIQDHLETTAMHYGGNAVVVRGSATHLDYLPDESVDLIFTDPPFGANINYSEMNLLWEAWLGEFTETEDEAIINKAQGKGLRQYQDLMTQSLRECHRVLRPGHWMLLVFMNSSSAVWAALRSAITDAGFHLKQANIFDKQHGTFKQFVSENTAGFDLVLHCWKPEAISVTGGLPAPGIIRESIFTFLTQIDWTKRVNKYLHVDREDEIDYRSLYSAWIAKSMLQNREPIDFVEFRAIAENWVVLHHNNAAQAPGAK